MEPTPTTPETGVLIKCPVCDWPPTRENPCPNCHTDLAPLRRVVTLPQRLLQMGVDRSRNGLPGAAAHLSAALVLDPQAIAAPLALGQVYLDRGEPVLALTQAEQALALEPQHPEALALKERCLAAQRQQRLNDVERAERRVREEKSATRWRRRFWLAAGAGLLLALIMVLAWPNRRLPRQFAAPAPVSRVTPAQVTARLASTFPAVAVTETQGELQLSGEVPTYKDLAELRGLLGDLPGINFGRLKVANEFFFRYRVKQGDSLSSLARKFYGQPSRWVAILEANPTVLKNPNLLQPGSLLIIPGE